MVFIQERAYPYKGQGLFWTIILRCPLCQSNKIQQIYDLKKISGKNYCLYKCKSCGVKYLNPLPSIDHQREYYNDPRYQNSRYFIHMKEGYQASPEFRVFERGVLLIEEIGKTDKGKILDVGCSSGVFLDLMRKRGWESYGVELCREFVNFAREKFDLDIYNGTLEDAGFDNDSFDVITMWDLIEHVPDPNSLLLEAKRILKPGGLLLILTPNEKSLLKFLTNTSYHLSFHLFKLPLSVVYDEHHIYYFNPGSLNFALNLAGYSTVLRKKESTVLDRILGPDSDHWLKRHRLLTRIIRFSFFLSNVFGLENKMLVVARKVGV